mmetsp:Transcript_32958/g.59426  ORF Transcript_32958/g.59426 Transcript_32958/m.59426 type:complete len:95 (+) Transcript_32958:199-483(+)
MVAGIMDPASYSTGARTSRRGTSLRRSSRMLDVSGRLVATAEKAAEKAAVVNVDAELAYSISRVFPLIAALIVLCVVIIVDTICKHEDHHLHHM